MKCRAPMLAAEPRMMRHLPVELSWRVALVSPVVERRKVRQAPVN